MSENRSCFIARDLKAMITPYKVSSTAQHKNLLSDVCIQTVYVLANEGTKQVKMWSKHVIKFNEVVFCEI